MIAPRIPLRWRVVVRIGAGWIAMVAGCSGAQPQKTVKPLAASKPSVSAGWFDHTVADPPEDVPEELTCYPKMGGAEIRSPRRDYPWWYERGWLDCMFDIWTGSQDAIRQRGEDPMFLYQWYGYAGPPWKKGYVDCRARLEELVREHGLEAVRERAWQYLQENDERLRRAAAAVHKG